MKQIAVIMLLLLLTTGCGIPRVRVGPTQTDTRVVERGNAESVRVDIKMGIGELEVNDGTDNLLDADFTYNIEDWAPEVDYDVDGNQGRLTIQQPDGNIDGIPDDDIRYEWDLKLADDVPVDLRVDLGVGESALELSGLALTNLDINTGVGDVTIDLTGDWEQSFNVDIDGGIGEATVYLPSNVGVRVETDTGIGTLNVIGLTRNGDIYTNEAYGSTDVTLDISISGGVGEITLELK
jgi:hypothetical protein